MMKCILSTLCVILLCHTASASGAKRQPGEGKCLQRAVDRCFGRTAKTDMRRGEWFKNVLGVDPMTQNIVDKTAKGIHDTVDYVAGKCRECGGSGKVVDTGVIYNGVKECADCKGVGTIPTGWRNSKIAALVMALLYANGNVPPLSQLAEVKALEPFAHYFDSPCEQCVHLLESDNGATLKCALECTTSQTREGLNPLEDICYPEEAPPSMCSKATTFAKDTVSSIGTTIDNVGSYIGATCGSIRDRAKDMGASVLDGAVGMTKTVRSYIPNVNVGYGENCPAEESKAEESKSPKALKAPEQEPTLTPGIESTADVTIPDTMSCSRPTIRTDPERTPEPNAVPTTVSGHFKHDEDLKQFAIAQDGN